MAEPTLADPTRNRDSSGTSTVRPKVQMLGKYRIDARIGKGGMGVVYQAEDTLLQRPVAIKILPRQLSADPVALERFLFEARSAARLNHPNIVLVYEISEVQGGWFLVMELVSGGSVQGLLQKRGMLPWREAVSIVTDACRGLIAAHEQGFIHRDIKPANILLSAEGIGKLADFGLAKALDARKDSLTSPDTIIGTPAFMSPEQCRAQPLDPRSDLYALGASLYTMLTGKAPFEATAPIEVLYAHCNAPRPDPRRHQAEIPQELVTLLQAAMAIAPDDRFGSAREMLQALERIAIRAERLAELPAAAPVPPPRLPRGEAAPSRKHRSGAETPTVALSKEPTKEEPTPIIRKSPRPAKSPRGPDSPTRRWLLRGLAAAAGLGGVLWLASRKKEDPTGPEGSAHELPFWKRIGTGSVSFPVAGPVSAVAIAPNMRWMAAASETGGLHVWDLYTGQPIEGMQGVKPREQTRTLAWTPDGKTLVAGLQGRLVHLTPTTGQVVEFPLPFPTGPAGAISCLNFSPDGEFLLIGRQAPERGPLMEKIGSQLYLLRAHRTTKEGSTGPQPSGSFLAAAYTPDGREILTLGTDGTVRAFDARNLNPGKSNGTEKTEAGERGKAFALSVTPTMATDNSPAGPYFVVADEQGLFFRRVTSWADRLSFWPLQGVQPRSIAYSADSHYWAAGVSDGRILVRNNLRDRGTLFELANHREAVRAVAFAPQGRLLLSGSDDKTVRLTSLSAKE